MTYLPRVVANFNSLPWISINDQVKERGGLGDFRMKVVTTTDGRTAGILHADGEGMPHFHTKASSFFILEGEMILGDRVAGPGTWGIEPYGAVHPNTKFKNVTYGLGMAEGDFGKGNVVLSTTDELPAWARNAGFRDDDFSTMADTNKAAWLPFGSQLWIKVVYVFERGGAFASIMRASAGAKLPRRRYLGAADMYLIAGKANLDLQTLTAGCLIHMPAGSDETSMTFEEDTEILVNAYGSIVEFDDGGGIARVLDGSSLRELALVRTDGGRTISSYGEDELQCAFKRFLEVSSLSSANA